MQTSILMPTFNGARFLPQQVESILGQTAADFELLAIDDGSSDETVSILDDFARRDRRVRRLAASGNRGQNRRLVELLAAASGEFVAIADQDDTWDRDRNARLLAAVGDRVLACGRSQLVDADGADLGLSILEAKGVDAAGVGPLRGLFEPLVSAHAAVFRRSWIDLAAFYGPLPFDLALGVEALFSGGLIYVDEAVVRHRIHGGNQMNGGVVPMAGKAKLLSRHRARRSLALLRGRRGALHQMMDYLARSAALSAEDRTNFRCMADTCWDVWFGAGWRSMWLKGEFHRRLDRYAGSSGDLAMFSRQIGALTLPLLAPVNLAAAWHDYRHGSKR